MLPSISQKSWHDLSWMRDMMGVDKPLARAALASDAWYVSSVGA